MDNRVYKIQHTKHNVILCTNMYDYSWKFLPNLGKIGKITKFWKVAFAR